MPPTPPGLWTWGDNILWDVRTWSGGNGAEIGAVKYTETYGMRISDVLTSQANTAEFGVIAKWDASRPRTGQVVKLWVNGERVFEGRVVEVQARMLYSSGADRTDNLHQFAVRAYDYSLDLMRRLVPESYGSEVGTTDTLYEIVKDIIDRYLATDGIDYDTYVPNPGPDVARIVFNYATVFEAFEALAKLVGYDWWIDYDKKLHFVSVGTSPDVTPFNLVDGATNFRDLELAPEDITEIANRVYVRGGSYLSAAYAQIARPAAGEDSIKLDYLPFTVDGAANVGAIYVGVDLKTRGIDGIAEAATYDFIVSTSSGVVRCDLYNSGSFAGTETVTVGYYYKIPLIAVQTDEISVAALKALGIGDGIFDKIIDSQNADSLEYARALARQELALRANPVITGSFTTDVAGFHSGQKLGVELTDRGYTAGAPTEYLVREVTMEAIGGGSYVYHVTFSTLLSGFNDFLVKLVDMIRDKRADENAVVDRIKGIDEEIVVTETTTVTVKSPPFAWSNDAGTTPNKLIWGLGEWA